MPLPSTVSSFKLNGGQSAFRSSKQPSNRANYIVNIRSCALQGPYPRQWTLSVLATFLPNICLSGYILAMWMRHIDLPTKSITFTRCSSTKTGVLALTVSRRYCCSLPCKASMEQTQEMFSTYYPPLINSKIVAEPILYSFCIIRKSHFSAMYHNCYIMWDNFMSTKCGEVSNVPHSEMLQIISEFPILDSYSVHKLKWTADI